MVTRTTVREALLPGTKPATEQRQFGLNVCFRVRFGVALHSLRLRGPGGSFLRGLDL